MILKHISRMLCLLISYSKFTRTKMKVLLTIHEMFYIIYEMIPKVSKAKGDYRIEQTAHLIRMRGLFLYMAYSKI